MKGSQIWNAAQDKSMWFQNPGNFGKYPINLFGVLQSLVGKNDIEETVFKRKVLVFNVD